MNPLSFHYRAKRSTNLDGGGHSPQPVNHSKFRVPLVIRLAWPLLQIGLLLFLTVPALAAYVPITSGVSQLSKGQSHHSCLLTYSGGVLCWGLNDHGQLGDNTTTNRGTPVAVSGLSSGVTTVVTGNYHTCALTSGGAVWCWGWNNYGQVGDNTTIQRNTPVAVSGLSSGVTALTAGNDHTCALIGGGAVWCWGNNTSGKLGDNTTTNRWTPVAVSGLNSGVTVLAAASIHTCALNSGGVWCWGNNYAGQLGDGTITERWTPVAVSGLSGGVTALAGGYGHSCALTGSGGVWCWGRNNVGQMGDTTAITPRLTPVMVSGLSSGMTAISAGKAHNCAVTSSGGVLCWGDNQYGQLGDGNIPNRHSPVAVSGLSSGVTLLSAGGSHTCALISSGEVKCWGYDLYGQLGDNSTTDRRTPVNVLINNSPPTATPVSLSLDPSGTPTWKVLEVLKGNYTYSDVDADVESGTTFQWYQATDNACSVGKTAIAGATTQTYTVVGGDVGKYLCVGVTPQNTGFEGTGLNGTGTEVLAVSSSVITKADQTISFTPPASGTYGGSATLTATATSSLTVSFASTTPSICAVSGNTVTYVGAGTCTVTADQVGDANYFAAPQVSNSFTVDQLNQTILFTPVTAMTVGDPPQTLSGTATSGLPVTFTSLTPSVCSVSGDQLMVSNSGICTLTATQTGNVNYLAAPQVVQELEIQLRSPRTLSLTLAGTGQGTVTSDPIDLDCSTTTSACVLTLDGPRWVYLTPTPATGSQLMGWTGDPACTQDGPGKVLLLQDTTCTATFDLKYYTLTVERNVPGVIITGEGMNCQDTPQGFLNLEDSGSLGCTATYRYGTTVKLQVSPAPSGWEFLGWGMSCDSQGQVQINQDRVCRARYQEVPSLLTTPPKSVENVAPDPVPEFTLTHDGSELALGSIYEVGAGLIDQPLPDILLMLQNTGLGILQLTGPPTLSGTNASDFQLVTPLDHTALASKESLSLPLRFTPGAEGVRTAQLLIPNNDPDEDHYVLTLQGIGQLAQTPAETPPPTSASAVSNVETTTTTTPSTTSPLPTSGTETTTPVEIVPSTTAVPHPSDADVSTVPTPETTVLISPTSPATENSTSTADPSGDTTTSPSNVAPETNLPAPTSLSSSVPLEWTQLTHTTASVVVNGHYQGAGQIISTDLDVQAGSSLSNVTFDSDVKNEGWLANFALTPDHSITGGNLTGTVINDGTLTDVAFWGLLLEGGTLAGDTVNHSKFGVISDVTLAPEATLTGGKIAGVILLSDTSTLEDVRLQEDTLVEGGQVAGDIVGEKEAPALLINVVILPWTYLENVILFFPLQLPEEVILGPGVVLPKDLNLGDFEPQVLGKLTNEGVDELPPQAFAEIEAEQLAALPEDAVASLDQKQVAEIPAEAFTGVTATQVAVLTPEAISGLSGPQLSQIPPAALRDVTANQMGALQRDTLTQLTIVQFTALLPTALGGLTAQNLGGLSILVIGKLTPAHVAALNPNAVKKQTGQDLGRLLVYLDAQQIQPTQVVDWLPANWKLDTTTGALTAPPGTVLVVRELPPPVNSPPQLILPAIPDLKSSFGVGGVGSTSFEEGLQQSLNQGDSTPDYKISQTNQGTVTIETTNDLKGLHYSFLPLATGITQAEANTSAGVERLEGGFYQMTTPEGQQIKFLPAPTKPKELAETNECGNVKMGPNGEVFMELPRQQQRRAGEAEAREVMMFDPLVEPPPEEYCEDLAGETVCDFTNAPLEDQPGFHILSASGTRAKVLTEVGKIVYNDGSSQLVYPTVLQPDTYMELGYQFDGVTKIVFNANGTFEAVHTSGNYLVTHQFEVLHQPLSATKTVEPSMAVENANVIYSIPLVKSTPCGNSTRHGRGVREFADDTPTGEAREVLTFVSLIESLPEELCEEINGEVICDVVEDSLFQQEGLPEVQ